MRKPISLAIRKYRERQLDDALSIVNRLVDTAADQYKVGTIKGWIHFRLGNWQLSIDSFESALLCNPKGCSAHFGLSQILSELGQFTEAEVRLYRWFELSGNHSKFYLNASWLAFRAGKIDEAIRLGSLGVAMSPRSSRLQYCMGLYLSSKPSEWELADRTLQRAIRCSSRVNRPRCCRAMLLRSRLLLTQGRTDETKELLASLVSHSLEPELSYAITYQYCIGAIPVSVLHQLAALQGLPLSMTEVCNVSSSSILKFWPLLIGCALSLNCSSALEARMRTLLDEPFADYYLHELFFCKYLLRRFELGSKSRQDTFATLKALILFKSDNYEMSCISTYYAATDRA